MRWNILLCSVLYAYFIIAKTAIITLKKYKFNRQQKSERNKFTGIYNNSKLNSFISLLH